MKHLHLAMRINVPTNMVCAIEYGAEGEYGLNSHELTMLNRLRNEKLNHCYNAIYDWGREGDMQPDNLFQIHTNGLDMPCTVLRVYCPIPKGIGKLYRKMRKIAEQTIHSYFYDWSVYDTNTIFSNPIHTPFLWSVGKCGTHIGMMNMEDTLKQRTEIIEKNGHDIIECFRNNDTWMDGVFSTNIFGSDCHAYYYDGLHLKEVSREEAVRIRHEWNKKVVEEMETSNRLAA